MVKALTLLSALSLTACGPFHLASGGTPPPAITAEQRRLDILECKDRVKTESQTAEDQARGFALGLTLSVVGVAVDYQHQKADQRRIFADCMTARGWTITVATD